jgi:hypothetical protein
MYYLPVQYFSILFDTTEIFIKSFIHKFQAFFIFLIEYNTTVEYNTRALCFQMLLSLVLTSIIYEIYIIFTYAIIIFRTICSFRILGLCNSERLIYI